MKELFEAGIGEEDPFGEDTHILFPKELENLSPEELSKSQFVGRLK